MANYYLEHHNGQYILSPEGNKAAGITFRTQAEGIEYAKKNFRLPTMAFTSNAWSTARLVNLPGGGKYTDYNAGAM